MVVMKIWADAYGKVISGPCFLKEYDADVDGYNGAIEFTDSIEDAMKFADFAAVMACWKRVSNTVPVRPDGKPNRPLSAFSISPVDVAD